MANMFFRRVGKDELFEKYLSGDKPPYTHVCFASYPTYYNDKKMREFPMVFGFSAHEDIEKLIEEMNSLYTNVQVEILDKRKFPKDVRDSTKGFTFYTFTVNPSEKFSENASFLIQLAFASLLRVYCPEYSHYKKIEGTQNGFKPVGEKAHLIQFICEVFNNSQGTYGNIVGDNELHYKTLGFLNSVKKMNWVSEKINIASYPYMSRLMEALEKKAQLPDGREW